MTMMCHRFRGWTDIHNSKLMYMSLSRLISVKTINKSSKVDTDECGSPTTTVKGIQAMKGTNDEEVGHTIGHPISICSWGYNVNP